MFPKAVTGSLERSGGATPRVMIEARDLEKVYGRGEGGVEALGSVSLGVGAGEWVSLVGPSGSGKSPLMNLLGLLARPKGGSYRLRTREVSALEGGGPVSRGGNPAGEREDRDGPSLRGKNRKECDPA